MTYSSDGIGHWVERILLICPVVEHNGVKVALDEQISGWEEPCEGIEIDRESSVENWGGYRRASGREKLVSGVRLACIVYITPIRAAADLTPWRVDDVTIPENKWS
jgi:hypothetical protein